MTRLPDPLIQACATARVIGVRASSIAKLGDQIASFADPAKVPAEEWDVLEEALKTLLKELTDEVETFSQKASCRQ
jgi:hypothetical protein